MPDETPSKSEFVRIDVDSGARVGEILPIPSPRYEPTTVMDYRKVNPPPRFQVRPPEGAPNVVIVLMDQLSLRRPVDVRRADPHADVGPVGRERADLHRTFTSTRCARRPGWRC